MVVSREGYIISTWITVFLGGRQGKPNYTRLRIPLLKTLTKHVMVFILCLAVRQQDNMLIIKTYLFEMQSCVIVIEVPLLSAYLQEVIDWNTKCAFSLRKSKIGFWNPKESENGFCVSLLNKGTEESTGSGFFGSFEAPWSEWSWIDLSGKQTQNPFSNCFVVRIQSWIFLKPLNAPLETATRVKKSIIVSWVIGSMIQDFDVYYSTVRYSWLKHSLQTALSLVVNPAWLIESL